MQAAAGDSAGWGLWLVGLLWVAAFIYVMARAASGKSFDTVHEFIGWLAYWAFLLLASFWLIVIGYWMATEESGYGLLKILVLLGTTYLWWFFGWGFLQLGRLHKIRSISQLKSEFRAAMRSPFNPPR